MKVSIVQYRDLKRWDAKYAAHIVWQCDKRYLRQLGDVLKRKKVQHASSMPLPMLSVHFDGTVTERTTGSIKGSVFVAGPGDLVYSKIDLQNGAVGVVPSTYDAVGFTSEFPVYEVRQDLVDKEYIKLVLTSKKFREHIRSLVSGTSGRKRIDPESFQRIPVPIPPLSMQRRIVNAWDETKQKASELQRQAHQYSKDIRQIVMQELTIKEADAARRSGPFVVDYREAERWDTFFFRKEFRNLLEQLESIGALPLKECAEFASRRWARSDFPDGFFNYIQISDVDGARGITGSSKIDIDHAPSRAQKVVRHGDILISTTRPYLGAFAMVPREYDGSVASSGFAVVEGTIDGLDKGFLLLFLKSYAGLKQFEQRMTGGLYPAIVQSELDRILIPVPPLSEQRRIVEKAKVLEEAIRDMMTTADRITTSASRNLDAVIAGKERPEGMMNG